MSRRPILIATDFSPASAAALEQATRLAKDTGGGLLLVHVQEISETYAPGAFVPPHATLDPSVESSATAQLQERLDAIPLADAQVPVRRVLLIGSPAEEILRLAGSEPAAWIVLGTHGRHGLTRVALGSVAETVLRHARQPVMVIKWPTEGAAAATE